MYLQDEAGNYDFLRNDELKDLGIETTLQVTGGNDEANELIVNGIYSGSLDDVPFTT